MSEPRFVNLRSLSGNLILVKDTQKEGLKCVRKIRQSWKEGAILREMDHINIVKLLYAEDHYLYMEMVEDTDLIGWCQLQSYMTLGVIRKIAFQLMQALLYLKDIGVIHRDIKPDNIMINHTTHFIKLVDFGLACWESDDKGLAGTVRYMAPECFENCEFSSESDLYSAAMTIYAVAARRMPLGKSSSSIVLLIRRNAFDYKKAINKSRRHLNDLYVNEAFGEWFKGCTLINVSKRFSVEQSMRHTFFAS